LTSSFINYLTGSVRNRSLDGIRDLKKNSFISIDVVASDVSVKETAFDMIVLEELGCTVDKAINSLPQQCKTIFLLIHEEELKYRTVADNLGVSVKTVDTQIYRARRRLRKALQAEL
jgi:RNA polymerase sigma-70 factor (ECF subfamily)